MQRPHAIVAGTIFDGDTVIRGSAVLVEEGHIASVLPRTELSPAITSVRLPERTWLAPGFIDTQVNGGGDVLFNDMPACDAILSIASAHRQFGTTSLLPTFISDSSSKMKVAIEAAREAAAMHSGILGIHLEGPFLSKDKPGVHDPSFFRKPTEEDFGLLTSLRSATTIVTLAPEEVPSGFIARLVKSGIKVALGHSMATYAQTRAALGEGLSGFTHLFNAMRSLSSREPGPIAAALEASDAWFGMIADGHHVAPAMLRLALRGFARPMLVTDAMPPVGGAKSSFMLYGEEIRVVDGCCLRADGTLAGAALDMASAIRNAVELLGVPLTDALRFASLEPARFLGLDDRLGRIAPGYRADLVAFDPESMHVCGTWVSGQFVGDAGFVR